jgi:hypothetical protein
VVAQLATGGDSGSTGKDTELEEQQQIDQRRGLPHEAGRGPSWSGRRRCGGESSNWTSACNLPTQQRQLQSVQSAQVLVVNVKAGGTKIPCPMYANASTHWSIPSTRRRIGQAAVSAKSSPRLTRLGHAAAVSATPPDWPQRRLGQAAVSE